MGSSSRLFPQDSNDPFNQITTSNVSDLSPWQSHSHQAVMAPIWHYKTPNERIEHENAIQKLESKLKKLKDRSDKYYFRNAMPDVSMRFSSSDSEEEEEMDQPSVEGDQEGQPLLWSNVTKKTEDQYTRNKWICCC